MNEVKEKKNHYFWVGVVSKNTWNLKKKIERNSTKFYMLGKKKKVVLFINSLWERIRDKMLCL